MPIDHRNTFLEQMYRTGERLLAAMDREAALAKLARESPDNSDLMEQWQRARKAVDTFQAMYCEAVEGSGYPDPDPIRQAIEAPESLEPRRTQPEPRRTSGSASWVGLPRSFLGVCPI